MVSITRNDFNKAWAKYREHHHKYREFDRGFIGFYKFLGMDEGSRYVISNYDFKEIAFSDLAAAKIKVLLNTSPDNTWVMLKAVCAKYENTE